MGSAVGEIAPRGRTWRAAWRRPGPSEASSRKSGRRGGQGSPHLGDRGRAEIGRGGIFYLHSCKDGVTIPTMERQKHKSLAGELRKAVRASGRSRYAISRATGVSESVLSRFMAGKFNLSLANVERIAGFLGLRLVQDRKPHKKGR